MRHRAPTAFSRLLDAAPRRGLAAGAVAALSVSAGLGLVAMNGPDGAADAGETVTAGPLAEDRAVTSYPDAAVLETMAAERASAPTDRGSARTRPSPKVSTPSPAPLSTSAAPARVPADPGSPRADRSGRGPGPADDRDTSSPSPTSSTSPDGPSSSGSPSAAGTPSASTTTSSPEPSATPTAGPETTAVTDLAVAGTWTVVISSDEAASFECSLDGGAWTACGPVATFTGLSAGRHTLAVRAVDASGTPDPTPAQLTTTVTGAGL